MNTGYVALIYDEENLDLLIQQMNEIASRTSFGICYLIVDDSYDLGEILEIVQNIQTKTQLKLVQKQTLVEFIELKYHECPHERLNDEIDETIQLIQHQIAIQASSVVGSVLISSENSAWVKNIREERLAWRDHEFDFYLKNSV